MAPLLWLLQGPFITSCREKPNWDSGALGLQLGPEGHSLMFGILVCRSPPPPFVDWIEASMMLLCYIIL
eukprot:366132-Chlamydomonas_euryale.AAC.5